LSGAGEKSAELAGKESYGGLPDDPKQFVVAKELKELFGSLDAETARSLIAAASDIALITDRNGIIGDVVCGNAELVAEGCTKWVGQSWADTVTSETREKVVALLAESADSSGRKWRQVNHLSPKGADIPILYSAVRVGNEGRVIAFGRDLRTNAALQQRLVEAQQSMERDYWRLRDAETRHRLLFQMATEAILVVDASSLKIIEANPAVGRLLAQPPVKIVGSSLTECFDLRSAQALQALLSRARIAAVNEDVRLLQADNERELYVSASLFRQEHAALFLVRLSPLQVDPVARALPMAILKLVESAPDGLAVTDQEGRILTANRAFIDLAQLTSEEQIRGELLDGWLGRSAVDFGVLMANLRQHGTVRLFATILRGVHGSVEDVEISAVSVPHGEHACYGFSIRSVGRRLTGHTKVTASRELPRSVEQLTALVGRVPLKDLVGETADMIEKLCIEAALQLTKDNRAGAAEMLGLSRQSLYVKLRRYGLGDLPSGEDSRGPGERT